MTGLLNLLARGISVVFHPLLMATYLFSFFALVLPVGLDPLREDNYLNIIFLVFSATVLLPSLIIGFLKTLGVIKSVLMPDRRERIIPFALISLSYIAFTLLLYHKPGVSGSDNLFRFLLIIDALVIISTLVTLFYRVSVHSLAWWGLIGILLPLNKVSEDGILFYPTIISIILAGLVMSARLQLNAHTPREILVGAMLGVATSFISISILF